MKAHLVNCTYCVFRQVASDPTNKKHQQELCKLTFRPIPAPDTPGRYCDQFHQEGHQCDSCWTDQPVWPEILDLIQYTGLHY